MGLFRLASKLGIRGWGRRPEWEDFVLPNTGEFDVDETGEETPVTLKHAGLSAVSGIDLDGAIKTPLSVDLREDVARYGVRLRIDDGFSATDTFAVDINSQTFSVTGSGGESKEDLLTSLRDEINNGNSLGTLTLTFTDNDPDAPTLDRSAGDWSTDGVSAGSLLQIDTTGGTGSEVNDGLVLTVDSVDSATSVTLVPSDDLVVTAETSEDYDVTALEQVSASIEDRSGDGNSETLVIATKLGTDFHPNFSTDDDEARRAFDKAAPSDEFSFTPSQPSSSRWLYDVDATTATVEVFLKEGGTGSDKSTGWRFGEGASWTVDWRGLTQRITTAGYSRLDIRVHSADGIVARAAAGPGILETTE